MRQLFYFDRAALDIASVPSETPLLKGWTDELIWKRDDEVKRLGFYADMFGARTTGFKIAELPPGVDLTDPVIVIQSYYLLCAFPKEKILGIIVSTMLMSFTTMAAPF
ncbi:hypothetical protein L1049_002739 [Liquidambar formosana]|uniref:Uncharacterized protein n=1 Tax=Liquidambar formosana TaxID=63359 RepID=A0AAP0R931_LIQFO